MSPDYSLARYLTRFLIKLKELWLKKQNLK